MKPSLYIESSVISYLTARPSRDIIVSAHQQITVEWWTSVMPNVDAYISELVVEEVSKGDEDAANERINRIVSLPLLDVVEEVDELAAQYAKALSLPLRAHADAYHMALATWHGLDYLVSWNCTHIASGRVQRILNAINDGLSLRSPILCTPEELMEV